MLYAQWDVGMYCDSCQDVKDEQRASATAWQHSCTLPSRKHVHFEAEADLSCSQTVSQPINQPTKQATNKSFKQSIIQTLGSQLWLFRLYMLLPSLEARVQMPCNQT